MDPFEAIRTIVNIRECARDLKRLSGQLMDEPDFKTDERLVAKYKAVVTSIEEFDEELTHKD